MNDAQDHIMQKYSNLLFLILSPFPYLHHYLPLKKEQRKKENKSNHAEILIEVTENYWGLTVFRLN